MSLDWPPMAGLRGSERQGCRQAACGPPASACCKWSGVRPFGAVLSPCPSSRTR